MSKIAERHGANFDKFIGDAIMCYFGDPESMGVREDAAACVRMALDMRDRLNDMQTRWRDQGLIDRPFLARMGINTGYCTVGNFGSRDRMDYTIIGNQVNLAARLESHSDAGGILLAAETYSLVRDWVVAEEQDAIDVKGIPAPIKTYRVRGTYEELAREETFFHHESDGLTVIINGTRTNRKKARKILEQVLANLNRSLRR
jgi:class 3 adenylate cyclase